MDQQESKSNQEQPLLPPSNNPIEDAFKQASTVTKILFGISFVCIIICPFITLENIGFTTATDNGSSSYNFSGFISNTTMWAINIGLGIIAGLCAAPKKIIPGVIAGAITTASITGITLLYTSWRETIYSLEFMIPIFLSIFIGWKTFSILGGKPKKLVGDDWNFWTGYQGKNNKK